MDLFTTCSDNWMNQVPWQLIASFYSKNYLLFHQPSTTFNGLYISFFILELSPSRIMFDSFVEPQENCILFKKCKNTFSPIYLEMHSSETWAMKVLKLVLIQTWRRVYVWREYQETFMLLQNRSFFSRSEFIPFTQIALVLCRIVTFFILFSR